MTQNKILNLLYCSQSHIQGLINKQKKLTRKLMQQKIKHKYVLLSVDLFRFLHDYSVKPRLIAV